MLVGVISLVVGVVGLSIAFVQLRRVGSVADAAAAMAARNEQQISGAIAIVRASDLEQTEVTLRAAASRGDRERAEESILSWRRFASEYQAILESAGTSDEALETDLELSLGLVDNTLDDLAGAQPPAEACRFILRHIGGVCGHSRRVAAAMMVSTRP